MFVHYYVSYQSNIHIDNLFCFNTWWWPIRSYNQLCYVWHSTESNVFVNVTILSHTYSGLWSEPVKVWQIGPIETNSAWWGLIRLICNHHEYLIISELVSSLLLYFITAVIIAVIDARGWVKNIMFFQKWYFLHLRYDIRAFRLRQTYRQQLFYIE